MTSTHVEASTGEEANAHFHAKTILLIVVCPSGSQQRVGKEHIAD